MSRIVLPPQADGVHGAGGDGYLDRVAKYIPAEIVAAYLTLQAIFLSSFEAGIARFIALLIILVILLVLTPLYIRKAGQRAGYPWKRQATISTVALVIWAYALAGLPNELGLYNGAVAAALLIVFTLVAGLVESPAETAPAPANAKDHPPAGSTGPQE